MAVEITKPIKIPPGVTAIVHTDGRKIPYEATPAENEVQTLTITGSPTGGSFTITLDAQTTAAIAFDATATDVQTALRLLTAIGPSGVDCTGGALPATPVVITFTGPLSGTDINLMTTTDSLTGGTAPASDIVETNAGTAGGGEAIGDIIQRDTDGTTTQSIGLITDVGTEYLPTAKGKKLLPTPVIAGHREDITMQVDGLIAAPIADATYADAAKLTWSGTEFVANATGAHRLVGNYTDAATNGPNAIVDINVIGGAKT